MAEQWGIKIAVGVKDIIVPSSVREAFLAKCFNCLRNFKPLLVK